MPIDPGPHDGYVAEREDPLGIGRVRATLPGVVNDVTSWLFPLGAAKGEGKGNIAPPDLNAEVTVWFLRGNPDNGRYVEGHWARGNAPVGAVVSNAGDNMVYFDGVIKVERDERAATKGFRVSHADGSVVLEYDAGTRRMRVYSPTSLDLKADGEIKIEAPAISINERPVLKTEDPI
jgi:hypothetical protein